MITNKKVILGKCQLIQFFGTSVNSSLPTTLSVQRSGEVTIVSKSLFYKNPLCYDKHKSVSFHFSSLGLPLVSQ